jgi:uncharacterized membrane protein YkvA (DUF1232 family)
LTLLLAVGTGLLLAWLVLALALVRGSRDRAGLAELVRLLPDLLRLLSRLARDATLPRRVRVRLWLLLAYLALPIDVIPDFVPVIGYADDAVLVAITLRAVVRRAGPEALERHWPGTALGLSTVRTLAGIGAASRRTRW